ncbi:hypothetical protein J6590_031752 [Homalodisca vitripennis]|nr:hypothetical protein J6590_031752 [Homalodisca vitripennis]
MKLRAKPQVTASAKRLMTQSCEQSAVTTERYNLCRARCESDAAMTSYLPSPACVGASEAVALRDSNMHRMKRHRCHYLTRSGASTERPKRQVPRVITLSLTRSLRGLNPLLSPGA